MKISDKVLIIGYVLLGIGWLSLGISVMLHEHAIISIMIFSFAIALFSMHFIVEKLENKITLLKESDVL